MSATDHEGMFHEEDVTNCDSALKSAISALYVGALDAAVEITRERLNTASGVNSPPRIERPLARMRGVNAYQTARIMHLLLDDETEEAIQIARRRACRRPSRKRRAVACTAQPSCARCATRSGTSSTGRFSVIDRKSPAPDVGGHRDGLDACGPWRYDVMMIRYARAPGDGPAPGYPRPDGVTTHESELPCTDGPNHAARRREPNARTALSTPSSG